MWAGDSTRYRTIFGPLDPAPSSGARALAFLIPEFRIPYGVWAGGDGDGEGEGWDILGLTWSDMARPMGARPGRGGRRAKGEGGSGRGANGKGIHGPLGNKKPRRREPTGRDGNGKARLGRQGR
jgi:hypothetical protein